MKAEIRPRKFNSSHIQQASAVNLADHFHNRLSVFGITIDDSSTVDRDDGIWLIELSNGNFELQVSITDVSTVIPKHSPIDKEAEERVITLYHTNPSTPMLPNHLSTNLGSLEEEQRRLALTIFFQIDSNGNVNNFTIKETIFTNKKAFSYEEVEKILANPQDVPEHKLLLKMQQLAHLFAQKRVGKSGILTTEGYVDEDGNLIKENVNTHQLIAEFMILTNATVGNFLAENNLPAIYRTQDVGTTDFDFVIKTMGHCLVPAVYESWAKPHVGLGLMAYAHFTSPLRRFVDLVNHRIVKNFLQQKSHPYSIQELNTICDHVNEFTEKFKCDRANYLKQKRKDELEEKYSHLEQVNIDKLSSEELSELIQYTAKNNRLKDIILSLEKRKQDLQPKDFYHIWFVGKIQHFLEDEEIDTISVLEIKSQLGNSIIDYKSYYCPIRQKNFAFCYLDGKTTLNPEEDSKKNKARQKAALATIKSYLKGELTSQPNNFPSATFEDFIKEQSLQKLETDIDLTNLDDKLFSQLIDYCLKNQFEEKIIEEIENRINRLSVKDLYKIWFKGKINKFFNFSNLDFTSVVLIYCQINNYSIKYRIEYNPSEEVYSALCCINNLISPEISVDAKKSRAKQKASMAYIQAYVNNTLITAPDIFADENEDNYPEKNADQDDDINPKKDIVNSIDNNEEKPTKLNVDWVSKLHYLCQANHWKSPEYIFDNFGTFFSCIVVLSVENKVLKSKGYGKSKKDAKQSASQVFMIQHQLET
ncbi:ribonuclease catalytic domain-containing protein [Cyanobacterium aponinum UTEX 3222]|uniref:ribonuclease catalytic domain-containing protein n=1 Tax=Cyanobacterium aponinum TaxID=379064 RepID=UPI003085572C|nr:ribonuclease catalytic domain-containing protein [Cyanobacterium aponinum UTEX 3222]